MGTVHQFPVQRNQTPAVTALPTPSPGAITRCSSS